MYVFLRENEKGEQYASALIPVTDVPIEERYTAEFLSHCVYTDEEVHQGWIYEDGHFHDPIEEPVEEMGGLIYDTDNSYREIPR